MNEDNSKNGWEFFFSTYPKDLALSKEIKIISEKSPFNEAIKESIDKLNLDKMPINVEGDWEPSRMFLDKVSNLETGEVTIGKDAMLTFNVNNLGESFKNKENANIMYPMETLHPYLTALGTDAFKEKKDSVIIHKKVNFNEALEELKDEAKKNPKNATD